MTKRFHVESALTNLGMLPKLRTSAGRLEEGAPLAGNYLRVLLARCALVDGGSAWFRWLTMEMQNISDMTVVERFLEDFK